VPAPVDVFISHAPADTALLTELEEHLSALVREGVIRPWGKGQLQAGEARKAQIERHLHAAPVVILLVSASYFAADELHDDEMTPAIERARAGRARLIPILVRPFDRKASALAGLTVLPDGEPVTKWPNRDEAWVSVVGAIRAMLQPDEGAEEANRAPEPAYENDEIRALAGRLARARDRRAALVKAGEGTAEVDREILDLRRHLREGGQLRAGDALGDGRYLLLRRLGRGGFASVWAAFDREREERVAVKVLHPDQAREPSRRERFFRGARVMATLTHRAVVRVLAQTGDDGGYLYFVMELIDGEDLHRAVLGGRFPKGRTVSLVLEIGAALAEAHAGGMVHRDVKPANILLDGEGRGRLTDFDLVAARDTTGGTRTGALGTMLFTAPEQMSNAKTADARADVYGLGMTAMFCLHGANLPEHTLRRPERVIEGLSCGEAVKGVLTRAIELRAEDRYADADAFCAALYSAAVGDASMAAAPEPIVPPPSLRPDVLGYQPSAPGTVDETPPSAPLGDPPVGVTTGGQPTSPFLGRLLPKAPAKRSWRAEILTLLAVGVLSSTLSAASRMLTKSHKADPSLAMSATATSPAAPVNRSAPPPPPAQTPCPQDMVLIPAGTFTMGSSDGAANEKPPHEVKLSAFCMDRTEVTVAAYRACTKEERNGVRCGAAGGESFNSSCNWEKTDREQHPINCVSWTQAEAYCKWAGGGLPTEAQWEYAARGADGRKYPWGPALPSNQLGWDGEGNDLGRGKRESTCPVGSHTAGVSPFGVQDMSGNVWEWVADWYAPYLAEGKMILEDPTGPDKPGSESRRVVRGGAWGDVDASWVRAANRHRVGVSFRDDDVGFRCSRGPKSPFPSSR
jgi:eukaryotic-like serine/threonine-protein kinase